MNNDETKIQILDAAIEQFWTSSYHATNMNALSDAAGLNKATVYQHFRSKEAIAIAAVQRAQERTKAWAFKGSFDKHTDPLDRLQSIHQRIHQRHQSLYEQDDLVRECPFVNIDMELSLSSDGVREAVQKTFAVLEAYYAQIVTALEEDGRLTHVLPATQLARDLLDNMNAVMVASNLEKRPKTILEAAERAKRYLIA